MGSMGSKGTIYNNNKLLICPKCWKEIPELIISNFLQPDLNLIIKCQCMQEAQVTCINDYLKRILKLELPQNHFCLEHKEIEGIQYCIQHSKWYCQECLYKHKKDFKKHQMIDYEFHVVCEFHQAQYTHYCEYCKMNLCEECKRDEKHKTHQIIPIPSIDPTQMEQDFLLIPRLIKKNEQKINMFILNLFNNHNELNLEDKRSKEQELLTIFEKYKETTEVSQTFFEHLLSTKRFCKANPNYHLNKLFGSLKINLEEINLKESEVSDLKSSNQKLLDYLKKRFILDFRPIENNSEDVFTKLNRKTNKCLFTLENHTSEIIAILEGNNKTLISASTEGEITQWNVINFKSIGMINVKKNIRCMILLENGKLACGSNTSIFIIDLLTEKIIQKLENINSIVNCLIQLKDKSIAFGASDNSINIWQDVGDKEFVIIKGHNAQVNCLIEYKDGVICSGSDDNTLKYWTIQEGICIKTTIEHTKPIRCIIKIPDDKVASGSEDKTIKIWDSNYNCIASLVEHIGSVLCLTLLDEQKIASGSKDMIIKIWDLNSLKYQDSIDNKQNEINYLLNLSNGLLVSSSVNTLFVWDI